jgi:hypothetical protein
MKIYISHSRKFDFQNELYKPLLESELSKKHEIIFPHDEAHKDVSTKDIIRECDLVVAEVSFPSIGEGIELGWANGSYVTTICFYKPDSEVSSSLKYVTDNIFEYDSTETMIAKVAEIADAL